MYDVECTYCKCFLPSIAYGVHVFSDIPKVSPCESTEVIYSPWHRGLLFASDVEVGASFCQYSHTRAPLGCWLYKWNGDSQSSWHIYLVVGTFRSHIKIKVITIQVCAVCHILFKAFYMDCLNYSSDTFGS